MKGVIAGINPAARVIDLVHSIPAFDVVQAAFRLRQAYPYFPKGTVHVAVVDPGVGGDRRIVAMESGGHLFLAPDNGTLAVIEAENGRAGLVSAAAGELLAMIGSFGMLEIAVRLGDAAGTLRAGPGTPVRVRRV